MEHDNAIYVGHMLNMPRKLLPLLEEIMPDE